MRNIKALIVITINTRIGDRIDTLDPELNLIASGTISRYARRWPNLPTLHINIGGHTFCKNVFTKPPLTKATKKTASLYPTAWY